MAVTNAIMNHNSEFIIGTDTCSFIFGRPTAKSADFYTLASTDACRQ